MPGTPPQGWQTPKTSYDAEDVLTPEQFERIEGNAYATELGERTIDPSQSPTGVVGTLRQLLDWFANRIRAITGTTNWHDAPPTTLTAAKSHIDAAAPHSGHETPTGAQTKVDAHANLTAAHSATSDATANRIILRDANGRAKVAAPAASDDIARKDTVDTAIDAAVTPLEAIIGRHIYDQYDLHMELYYTGHHSGPSIAGLLGMTFDGFQDTLRIDGGNTTAEVLTTSKLVRCRHPRSYVTPNTATNQAVSGLADNADFSNPNYMIDQNEGTKAELSIAAATTQIVTTRHDLGSARVLSSIKVAARRYSGSYPSSNKFSIGRIAHSLNGSTWTVVDVTDLEFPNSLTVQWSELVLPSTVYARYFAIEWTCEQNVGASTVYYYVDELQAGVDTFQSSLLVSTAKALPVDVSHCDLYMSVKENGGTLMPQVSVNGGVTWQNMTLESSREDPQFAGYTERHYTADAAVPGDSVVLKIMMTPGADTSISPEVKRYGLYWS